MFSSIVVGYYYLPMLFLLQAIVEVFSFLLGIAGIGIIVWGASKAAAHFLLFHLHGRYEGDLHTIRLSFSHHLLLGIDFFVGKDIIELVLTPGLADLLVLLTVIIIRVILGYHLNKDVAVLEGRTPKLLIRKKKK